MEKPAIDEVRILLGAARAGSAHDHVWCRAGDGAQLAPRLLDDLPPAERYLVIVPCQRVALFRVPMPAGARRKVEEALPFLVEERLLEPVERYEVWPLWPADRARRSEALWLAVLERDWLAGVRKALAGIGNGEVRWVLAGWGWEGGQGGEAAADAPPPVWRLRVEGDAAVFNAHGVDPRLLPLAGLPEFLALAWAQTAPAERPGELRFDAPDAAAAQIEAFCLANELPARAVDLPAPLQADYDACPYALLRQTRSPWRREWRALFSPAGWPRWRPAAWVALALVAIELAAPALSWALLSLEHGRRRAEATALYREIAGPQAAIVNPLLQMRRAFQNRRHAEGKTAPDDFLPLLAGVSAVLPANLRQYSELGYENARLRIVVPAVAGTSALAVGQTLREAGWAVKASAAPDNGRWTFVVSRP